MESDCSWVPERRGSWTRPIDIESPTSPLVQRVHLVVDLELNRSLRALLPKRDMYDRLHDMQFWLLCVVKGMVHLAEPQLLLRLIRWVVRLRVKRKSTL